jgi:hypothetical protein
MQGFLKAGNTYRTLNDVQYIDKTEPDGLLIQFYDEHFEEYNFESPEARDTALDSLFKAMGAPVIEFESSN